MKSNIKFNRKIYIYLTNNYIFFVNLENLLKLKRFE